MKQAITRERVSVCEMFNQVLVLFKLPENLGSLLCSSFWVDRKKNISKWTRLQNNMLHNMLVENLPRETDMVNVYG